MDASRGWSRPRVPADVAGSVDARELERRLDAGETVEVRAEPKHGLQTAAMGAAMAGFFSLTYVPRALEDPFLAVGLGVVAVPAIAAFLWVTSVGIRRWRTPPVVMAFDAEGVRPFGYDAPLRWNDILGVEPVAGGRLLEIETKPGVELRHPRTVRWSRGVRRRPRIVIIPARPNPFEADALIEVLEARVRREMLAGKDARAFPEPG